MEHLIRINPLNSDLLPKPLKVLRVMRQQCRNAIGLHGGDDVGIVHLLAADLKTLHQFDKLAGDSGGIVRHLKALFQVAHSFDDHFRG